MLTILTFFNNVDNFFVFGHFDKFFDISLTIFTILTIEKTILETCDIWDTYYKSDNWEPEFMTIFVTRQLIVTLDSLCNSCDVLSNSIKKLFTFQYSIQFNSIQFNSIQFNSIQYCFNKNGRVSDRARPPKHVLHLVWRGFVIRTHFFRSLFSSIAP